MPTPAFTAASASFSNFFSISSTASRVFCFSFRATICQKYCSACSVTALAETCFCSSLTATPTCASLFPLTICPPAKTGCTAITPAITPLLIMEKGMVEGSIPAIAGGIAAANDGGSRSDKCTSAFIASVEVLKPMPTALTCGKKFVSASCFCWRACCTALSAVFMRMLCCSASVFTCCRVSICCACATHAASSMAARVIFLFIVNFFLWCMFFCIVGFCYCASNSKLACRFRVEPLIVSQ